MAHPDHSSASCSTSEASSQHKYEDEASCRSSSRSVSVTHGFSFPSLSAAISRSNGILEDLDYFSGKVEADVSSNAAIAADSGIEISAAHACDAVEPAVEKQADICVFGPFDFVSGVGGDSREGFEDNTNATSPSRSSDGQSCASMATPECETATVRAKAAQQRHSMASNWMAQLQLLPTPVDVHPEQSKLAISSVLSESAAESVTLFESKASDSEATSQAIATALPPESAASATPDGIIDTQNASEDLEDPCEPRFQPTSTDISTKHQTITSNQSKCSPDAHTNQQAITSHHSNRSSKSHSAEAGMESRSDEVVRNVDAVQLQMNKAIAAAVAAAAISAVVESHAAAERAALIECAHKYHAVHLLQCQQKEAEILDTAFAHVRWRIAAMQVARHWKAWRLSPAWHKRVAAATCIQAQARGFLLRRDLPKIHHTAACEKKVRVCMNDQGACVATLKAALECAEELQNHKCIHALSMRIEAVVGRLAAALMAAARAGTHEQFKRVQAEAELLQPQLQQSLAEAAKCVSDRQTKALQHLGEVCHSGSLQEYTEAVQVATNCGADLAMLAKQKQVWDRRCSTAAQELTAVVHSKRFEAEEFSKCQQKAQALGLNDALRAASSHLKSRRSALVREIHLARKGGDLDALRQLRPQAVALEMQDALPSIDATLQEHVATAETKLQNAANTCFSLSSFESCVQAAKSAGVPSNALNRCQMMFTKRVESSASKLLSSAASDPLSRLPSLIRQAWALQQQSVVSEAVELVYKRSIDCCSTLQSALASVSSCLDEMCTELDVAASNCACWSKLTCLAAALKYSTFKALQQSQSASWPQIIESNALGEPRDAAGVVPEAQVQPSKVVPCTCIICRACQDTSGAINEACKLYLGPLALRAAAAFFCGLTRASLTASTRSRVYTVTHDYSGWIHCDQVTDSADPSACDQDQDLILSSYEAQCKLQPDLHVLHVSQPVVVCSSMRLMLGFRSFQAHQQTRRVQSSEQLRQPVPEPSHAVAAHSTQGQGAPEGALELSEIILQSILGDTEQTSAKQLCLMFSGLRSLGKLSEWCPRLQCLSLKANHLQSLQSLAPLATHLSHLDVSDNSISTLTSLSSLTNLRSLAVSNNELTSFHGIIGMKRLQIFAAAHNSVCSVDPSTFGSPCLAHIDLSSNCITCINGLKDCPRLLIADLSRNLLASLHALSSCSLLQDLSVSENRVESIDGVFSKHLCLQRLKLASNRISALTAFPWMPHLRSLDISDNPLATLQPFTLQPALTALNIAFCTLTKDRILAAVAPLGQLASLQVHDNSSSSGQSDRPDSAGHQLQSDTLRVLPWLRDLDHMETRFCDMVPAAVSAFCATPHLLLSWRQRTLSGQAAFHPISTNIITATADQDDSNGHLDDSTDRCSTVELLSCLGMHKGYQRPFKHCDIYGHDPVYRKGQISQQPPPSPHSTVRKGSSGGSSTLTLQATADALERKLQEQSRIMSAHSSACSQLLKALVMGGVDVDQSICIEQLSSALQKAQTSAAASVLGMVDWRPQGQSSELDINSEWQQRWSLQRSSAAGLIQKFWRSRFAKKSRIEQLNRDAAVRIQSWMRGTWVRRQDLLSKLRTDLNTRQSKAALIIQATWKGHRVRKLLSRARAAAQSFPEGQVKGVEPRAAAVAGDSTQICVEMDESDDEDFLLPELGGDLMRELDLLDAPPAVSRSVSAVSKAAAHAPAGTVLRSRSTVTAQLPSSNGALSSPTPTPSSVPQLPASTSPSRALQSRNQMSPHMHAVHARSPEQSMHASAVADASQISSLLDSDSPLARRFRLHKMQQATKQQKDSCSGSHGVSSPTGGSSGAGRNQIPAFRPTMDMPHVHVAALAAIRAQQQQYAASVPSHSDAVAANSVSVSSAVPDSTTGHPRHHQEPSPVSETQRDSPSPQHHTDTAASSPKRRSKAAENVMKEWGFESEATAQAYLRSKRRMLNKKNSRNHRRVHPTAHPHEADSTRGRHTPPTGQTVPPHTTGAPGASRSSNGPSRLFGSAFRR